MSHVHTQNNPSARELLATQLYGLYVVTDKRAPGSHVGMAQAALAGGAQIIQLRVKDESTAYYLQIAHQLRTLTHNFGSLLIINDRVDIALASDADGVHLGPDDMPIQEARRLMPEKLIGASCGDVSEALEAWHHGADYIGAGAVFGSQTKLDAGDAIGLDVLQAIAEATPLPVAAIGGVTIENIRSVVDHGAQMACVVSAISAATTRDAMVAATHNLLKEAAFPVEETQ